MTASSLAGLAAVAGMLVGLLGCASPSAPEPADADAAFLEDAARQDLLESRLGDLAQRYAQLPEVAGYGRRMTEDHDRALSVLRHIAEARRAALPDSPDAGQMETYYRLSHLAGDDFHRQYMDFELWAKRGELETLRREALGGRDSQLVVLARERQPVVAGDRQLGIDVEVRNHLNVPLPTALGGDMR